MVKLTIEFPTKQAMRAFASWMCEQGEQDYWTWAEEAIDKKHTVASFHYHGVEDETKAQDDASRYGQFLEDDTIRTKI